MNAYDLIIRAKVQLQATKPFFSYLIMNLKIKEENAIPSMAVSQTGDLFCNKE